MRGFVITVAWLLGFASASPGQDHDSPHVVEELTFRVPRDDRQEFLKQDAAIWTKVLARQPGYLGKETWLGSHPEDQLKLIIRWRTRRDWNAVPKELIAETDRDFRAAMGRIDWEMIRGRGYRVVVSPQHHDTLAVSAWLNAERLKQSEVVEIARDPVYHRPKRYLAVRLQTAIEQLAIEQRSLAGEKFVVFDCTDDYHSEVSLETARTAKAWLAFRDLDAGPGHRWINPEKMGEAYVVWTDIDDPSELTWPYAVERIRVITRPESPPRSAPPPD